MPKAHPDDLDPPALNRLLRVLDELHDPRIIVKRRMPRPRNQNRIDFLQRRVRVQVIHDVVALDTCNLVEASWWLEQLAAGVEQRGKDARVAAELGERLGLRRVGLEDGEA